MKLDLGKTGTVCRDFFNAEVAQIKSFATENKYLKKVFAVLCALYGIGFLAIIRANVYYKDDLVRTYFGGRYWARWSRYGSEFLSTLIHADTTLSDISPLTQLLAVLFLALASTIFVFKFFEKKEYSFLACIAVLPLGMSPYFLGCVSYKFDAPYMAFSVLAAAVPLLFCDYKDRWALISYGIVTILCTVLICITYQVSLGIFPMAVIVLAARKICCGERMKKVLKFVGISTAFYLFGLIVFKLFIMKTIDSGYASNTVLPLKGLPLGCLSNLKEYYGLIWSDFKTVWKILAALICLCFVVLFTLKSKTNKVAACLVSILALVLCAVLSFPYIVFDKPLFAPRGCYGFGAFLALIGLQGCNLSRFHIAKILAFCLSWCFFSFAFEYGNALYQQQQWKDFRVGLVVSDLNQIVQDGNTYTFQLVCHMDKAPSITNKRRKHRILDRLVPVSNDYPGFAFYIRNFFGLQDVLLENESLNLNQMDLPVLKDTKYHTIRGDDEHILVLLK